MRRTIVLLVSASLVLWTSGCVTVLRGMGQSVLVRATREGRTVTYGHREVADGEIVHGQKETEPPRFHVEGIPIDMRYKPDPLLLGDAALLLVFVAPGLVALGVDFGMGSWRNFRETQYIVVPEERRRAPPRGRSGAARPRSGGHGASAGADPSGDPTPTGRTR